MDLLATVGFAVSACRPECTSEQVRFGDKCVKRPDAGVGGSADEATLDAAVVADMSMSNDGGEEDAGAGSEGPPEMDELVADAEADGGWKRDGGTAEADGGLQDDGGTFETDPCEPNPCAAGLTCHTSASGEARCAPACASDAIGCQRGARCAGDADCASGGDGSASCDPIEHVCVTVCGTTTIVSPANLEAATYCREINGDLLLDPTFGEIDASALPHLTRVRGNVSAASGTSSVLVSVTLSRLESIDGALRLASLATLRSIALPRLRSIGTGLLVTLAPALESIALPLLNETGDFGLVGLPKLTQVDLGKLAAVDGSLSLRVLCTLPWSQLAPLENLGTSQSISAIGCCTTLGTHNCGGPNSCVCN